MAVELFLSNASYHANQMLIKKLEQKRKSGSIRHIVIVPDRFGLSAERNVLEDLNIFGSFDITVTSFRRLATTLLGKKAGQCMSAEGSVMLLSKVILDQKDNLKYFVNAHKKAGFAQEIYAVLTLIRNSGVSAQMLLSASQNLPELARKKCEDIAFLYSEYLKELASGKTDGSSLLETFTREIPESDYIANADIYISDYFSFTVAQREVICALMKSAKSVNIAMVKGNGKNARIYPEKELARLCELAKKVGQKVVENYEDAPLSLAREKVASELFAYGKKEKISGGDGINIYEAETVKEEVVHLARRIKLLVKQGYRYKDISVLAGDVDGYLPTIKKVFGQEDVPFFANEQKILLHSPLADYIVQALRVATDGLERERALTLLKNPYMGANSSAVSDFEIYSLKYNVNFSRLLGEYTLGKCDKEYLGATKARQNLCSLNLTMAKKAKIKEFTEAIALFIKDQNLEQKCNDLAKAQEEKGDLLSASATTQSFTKLVKALDELTSIAGESEIEIEGFISMFLNALASIKISFIPVFADAVYIGGAVESRFSAGKVFFIIGAKEGVLPAIKKSEGILGDSEVDLLKKNEVFLSPTSFDMGLEEKLHILQLLLMPKEKLFISYPQAGASSELKEELVALFDDIKVENAQTIENSSEFFSLLLSSEKGAKSALYTQNLNQKSIDFLSAVVGEKQIFEPQEVQKIENGEKLYYSKKSTSVTRIESYFRCPYKNFLENGLGARGIESANSSASVGTFMHRVLEVGLKELTDNGFPDGDKFDQIAKSVLDSVFAEEEFGALSTEKYYTLKKRLIKESYRSLLKASQRCKRSKYIPTGFEVRFGDSENLFLLKGKNLSLALHGVVDRIDENGEKVLLLDYKTGKAPSSMEDVYFGTGVQLYVYMSAIENAQSKKAIGALYYPLVGDYEKEEESKDRLCGFVIDTEMSEVDTAFDKMQNSDFFEYGVKGKELDATSKKTCCTQEELDKIKEYSLAVCEKAIEEISGGYIEPSPLEDICKYCNFAILCDKSKKVKKRKKSTVKKSIITGVE